MSVVLSVAQRGVVALHKVVAGIVGVEIHRVPLPLGLGSVDAALHAVSLACREADVAHVDGSGESLVVLVPGSGEHLHAVEHILDGHLAAGKGG